MIYRPESTRKEVLIVRPKLLLGEGEDDIRCFESLLLKMGLSNEIQVDQYGGKDKLGPALKALKARPGYPQVRSLGITRDCDYSKLGAGHQTEASAFDSVRSALTSAGLPVPEHLLAKTGSPSVCVMIVPGSGCAECWRTCSLIA